MTRDPIYWRLHHVAYSTSCRCNVSEMPGKLAATRASRSLTLFAKSQPLYPYSADRLGEGVDVSSQPPSGFPRQSSLTSRSSRTGIIPFAHTRYLMLLPWYRGEQSMWACLRLPWHCAIVEVDAIRFDRLARCMIRYAAWYPAAEASCKEFSCRIAKLLF